jgi:hypothetical protein
VIIVLIHWRIKTTNEDVAAFYKWWTEKATIEDKSSLAGEYLSKPLPAGDFNFLVDDLSPKVNEVDHWGFVNVGLWDNWKAFYQQVGHNFRDDRGLLPFEAARRTRTILEPQQWRIGAWELPQKGTCD